MGLTTKEVLELIRAGYTKAEIDAMIAPDGTATPEQGTATPEQGTAGKQTAEHSAENKQNPENSADHGEKSGTENRPDSVSGGVQSEVEKLVGALGLKLDALTRAVVGRNIGGIEGTPMQETADSIVARIINPHINETEGGK